MNPEEMREILKEKGMSAEAIDRILADPEQMRMIGLWENLFKLALKTPKQSELIAYIDSLKDKALAGDKDSQVKLDELFNIMLAKMKGMYRPRDRVYEEETRGQDG